jgi:hypothetical protein
MTITWANTNVTIALKEVKGILYSREERRFLRGPYRNIISKGIYWREERWLAS